MAQDPSVDNAVVFPRDFVWGSATSAYQIDGAPRVDGKGESIWDRFSHTPGKIANGDTGDVACDHYYRYPDDLQLMADLGIKAYRFSIAWTRIFPEGKGVVPIQSGIDFYSRLVDAVLEKGIALYPTLYHWDLPQVLQDNGGWQNRDTAKYFADYADTMVRHLGDRVTYWATLNEPSVQTWLGYITGEHAPGRMNRLLALRVAHNLLLAHGTALKKMRASRPKCKYGIVLFMPNSEALGGERTDERLAESNWHNECQWFLRPLLYGQYPKKAKFQYGAASCLHWLSVRPQIIRHGDMDMISEPLDWLGINYYFRDVFNNGKKLLSVPGAKHTAMDWEINPVSFARMLIRLDEMYAGELPPIFITENGAAFDDVVEPDGIHDADRIEYIRQHLKAVRAAISNGVDIRGYFAWSLLDNFEWQHGYSKRFGLVHVDFNTQKRTPKDSAYWYSKVIADNAVADTVS